MELYVPKSMLFFLKEGGLVFPEEMELYFDFLKLQNEFTGFCIRNGDSI